MLLYKRKIDNDLMPKKKHTHYTIYQEIIDYINNKIELIDILYLFKAILAA